MKTFLCSAFLLLLTLFPFLGAEEASVTIDVKEKEPVPLYYSAHVSQTAEAHRELVSHTAELTVKVIQGKPETFSFALQGGGRVREVVALSEDEDEGGESPLQSWSTRRGLDGAYLELAVREGQESYRFQIQVEQELTELPAEIRLWNLGSGEAVGFQSEITVTIAEGLVGHFEKLLEVSPKRQEREQSGWQNLLGAGPVSRELMTATGGEILLAVAVDGAPGERVALRSASLRGTVTEEGGRARFQLRGQVVASQDGVELPLLKGSAAVGELPEVAGLRFFLRGDTYFVEVAQAGSYPLTLTFLAPLLSQEAGWGMDFTIPAATLLPVELRGLSEVTFPAGQTLLPQAEGEKWLAYLPAGGRFQLAWQKALPASEGALLFSSQAEVDVEVGAGLLRQESDFSFRILQGEMSSLQLELSGPGEVLAVTGPDLLSWERNEEGLVVALREARTGSVSLQVTSQLALGAFPVEASPLQLTPGAAVSHSGHLRVRDGGAVHLQVTPERGLMQLPPEAFPGASRAARQQFVYRFPSADYALSLQASQIVPEVMVNETVLYQLGESGRALSAEVELDIRESTLREWTLELPAAHAVVSVSGAAVADYVVSGGEENERRSLRILFAEEVAGRQLLRVQLENNELLPEGDWVLPKLGYPGAQAVRGDLGIAAEPGVRVSLGEAVKLAEKPLSYFPKRPAGLQLAFRQRERDWSATLQVERLPGSVEADVFHLYSLKDGTAYGSVVVNYFVTGSPVDEWRLRVPAEVGNVAIDGQQVRTWRREGEEVIVTLQQPVMGLFTLLLTCEEKVGAQGGSLRPGRVQPLGVRDERGYVQVVSPVQVQCEVATASGGLLKLDVLELPAEFRLSSSAPSLAVYQYTARPFELALAIDWYEPGETVAQVVEFAEASSRVSRDGEVVTDMNYSLSSRGSRILRVTLPAGVSLWETRVAGEAVNARVDEGSTLIPLPPGTDANERVAVSLRYGQAAQSSRALDLALPTLAAPVLQTAWDIAGDERRELRLRAGSALAEGERGFVWLVERGLFPTLLLLALLAAVAVLARPARWVAFGLLMAAFLALAYLLTLSFAEPGSGSSQVSISVPVLAPGEEVVARLVHAEKGRFGWDVWSLALMGGGVLLTLLASLRGWGMGIRLSAFLAAGAGALWLPGGAFWFFVLLGGAMGLILLSLLGGKRSSPRTRGKGLRPSAGLAGLMLGVTLAGAPRGEGAEIPAAESLRQVAEMSGERFAAEGQLTLRGEVGDRFRLLGPAATLRGFSGEGLLLSSDESGFWLTLTAGPDKESPPEAKAGDAREEGAGRDPGWREATFSYQMPAEPSSLTLPTPAAAVSRLDLALPKAGWEVVSDSALVVEEGAEDGQPVVRLLLLPQAETTLSLRPRERDPLREETAFFVEVANAYLPGPGLLEGRHHATLRPAQGVVRQVRLLVPEGLTVSRVGEGPVAGWRFDVASRELVVDLATPQAEDFSLLVVTQRSLGALPLELALAPLRVKGAEREVGSLGLAFGGEAQAGKVTATGLLEIHARDFPSRLLRAEGEVLHRAYRYGAEAATLQLGMVPVEPEIRVESEEVLSLGAERILLKSDLRVTILRAGIFRFRLPLPPGFEVESFSGEALSHWDESEENGERVVIAHLGGQTLGENAFSLVLAKTGTFEGEETGDDSPRSDRWTVPRVVVAEATRQSGQLIVRAEQGLRLRTLERKNVSELDPRAAGLRTVGDSALAYRLLQKEWELTLGVEELEPWVTGQILQEVTLREGQTRHLLLASLEIENAAIRTLRVALPDLSEEMAKTLRASGEAVSGIFPVPGEAGLWEITFQRRVLGSQAVRLEWERTGERTGGQERLTRAEFPALRQANTTFAFRAGSHLEVTFADLPEGWYRVDWTALPGSLRRAGEGGSPAAVLRAGPGPLTVQVTRHAIAEALKLRVSQGQFTTVVSPLGDRLTAARLQVEVVQRSSLRIAFPGGAELFHVFVNGESVNIVRDGGGYLFYVVPGAGETAAEVEFAYAQAGEVAESLTFRSPEISVPLEDIVWRVIVPEDFELGSIAGDLDLQEESAASKRFGKDSYLRALADRSTLAKEKAIATFDKADSLLQAGQQAEALLLYQNVANNYSLDGAFNEDARVKLNRVQSDQIVVGLNSRRQRLYLDNALNDPASARNNELEVAAAANGILQGEVNFKPTDLEQLLLGNSAEENDFLRRIADRLLKHQKTSEPAPQALAVPVPAEGQELIFRRSVRVAGSEPLTLRLALANGSANSGRPELVGACLLLLALAAACAYALRPAKR
ncbi:hypothetical protein [Roseibacillus ishigakijimensis]|uniref:Uncharacterized protein n=1 Tax=Roseibacillus ishigakijimensis TaxID=454146 RepID=A0A934RTA4_9BACT|nr:hypothetical protein [Roseibacillus ishigakijimensis]MBK1833790.1 hypothetical protein [Roseibacillus ishigakijimensis]